ncbi:MAG: nucleotidyltransferase family protein [Chloroflexi bacterium]|nr:nucleotidyltransferase family protein [Chloroflexota bacterium]
MNSEQYVNSVCGRSNQFLTLLGQPQHITPEQALVLFAARVSENTSICPQLLDSVRSIRDWNTVLATAARHGVSDLLQRVLATKPVADHVPEWARESLDEQHAQSRRQALSLMLQLSQILRSFSASGVSPTVIKGAALALTMYPHPSLRPMGDIDLIVPKSDLDSASAVLERLGYEEKPLYYSQAFNRRHGYHVRYVDPASSRLAIELHWDLVRQREHRHGLRARDLALFSEQTLLRLDPMREPVDVMLLKPSAHLVYLCVHAGAADHAFGRLIWLTDAAVLAARLTVPEWKVVVRLAKGASGATATYIALALAQLLLDAPIPRYVLDALRPPPGYLWIVGRVLHPAALLEAPSDERRTIIKYFGVDQPMRTVAVLCEHLLPPPEAMLVYDADRALRSMREAYIHRFLHLTQLGVAKAWTGVVSRDSNASAQHDRHRQL